MRKSKLLIVRSLFLFYLFLFLPSFVFAQKIVFADEYNLKNISIDGMVSAGGAAIVQDNATNEKLLIFSGKKELIFYAFDAQWKLVDKVSKKHEDKSMLKGDNFIILRSAHNQKKWSFIVRNVDGLSKETIDFSTGSHTVDGRYLEDIAKNYLYSIFLDGSDSHALYFDKNGAVSITRFAADFTAGNVKLDMGSALPVGKSKKYTARELYEMMEPIDTMAAATPYFTRRKVHLYTRPAEYAVLVFNDEPVAELSYYDKQTGRKTRSGIFSAESLLPEAAKGKTVNTAALLSGDKLHLLVAYKNGGVYAIYDAASKKELYHYNYSEQDKSTSFNYGPVMYETLPGTINLDILREKVEDISMDKFCTEMYKHSCAITVRQLEDGNKLVQLANYDQKELAAATSSLRMGMNTMTSSAWYVSTSAGLIFEPASLQPSAKKVTWNDVSGSKAGAQYQKAQPAAESSAEYNHKKAVILKTQIVGDMRYIVYFYDRQLKIDARKLDVIPPKVPGLVD